MSLTHDRFFAVVSGHEVAVVARSAALAGRYELVIDGVPQDSAKTLRRDVVLEGSLPTGDSVRVRVEVSAWGLGGQRYFLIAEGRERLLGAGWLL